MLNAHSPVHYKAFAFILSSTCWVRQVLTLAINNVAQKEEATLKSCEDVAGARRTPPPVDYMWCLEPSFPGLSVNSDNLPFSYVIFFMLFTLNYMNENWSWHAYRFALGFPWKNRCDINQVAMISLNDGTWWSLLLELIVCTILDWISWHTYKW
jgi:hypothetical protein